MLQQYLPLAVLKRSVGDAFHPFKSVATVPTACGIETFEHVELDNLNLQVATVPTACGIET